MPSWIRCSAPAALLRRCSSAGSRRPEPRTSGRRWWRPDTPRSRSSAGMGSRTGSGADHGSFIQAAGPAAVGSYFSHASFGSPEVRLRHALSREVRRRARRIHGGRLRLRPGRSSTRCGPSPRPGRAPTASARPSALTPSTRPADTTPSSARSASTPTAIPSSSSSPSTRSTHRRPAGRATGSSTSSRTTAQRRRSGPVRRRDSILRGSGARMRVALARGSTVEHLTLDQGVPGSNPGAPANSQRVWCVLA